MPHATTDKENARLKPLVRKKRGFKKMGISVVPRLLKECATKRAKTTTTVIQAKVKPKKEQTKTDEILTPPCWEVVKSTKICHFELHKQESRRSVCDGIADICVQEMWDALQENEWRCHWAQSDYMRRQPDIDMSMRRVLIDWLVQVQESKKMHSQCIHLAVSYIDRFLSKMSVPWHRFQLLGVAAMFVASKVEEIYPPFSEEWAKMTAGSSTGQLVRKMEKMLLHTISFDVQPPTILTFIEQLCSQHNMDKSILYLAMYLSELMLVENTDYLEHLPSKIASSSVALARMTLNKEEAWPKKLESFTKYSMKQLSPVVKKQQKIFVESPSKPQQGVQKKYKSPNYKCVGKVKPIAFNLDDDHSL